MLLKGSTNFHEVFDREIGRAERTTKRFGEILEPKNVNKWWPEIIDKLRGLLLENLKQTHLNRAWTSPRWRQTKSEMMNAGVTKNRIKGGGELPVLSNQSWHMTDAMMGRLTGGLSQDRGRPKFRPMEITIALGVDVDDFIESDDPEYAGLPYPIAVDGKMMERSGGQVGLVRLNDEQISQILDLLVKRNENIADRIFRGVHFQGKPHLSEGEK